MNIRICLKHYFEKSSRRYSQILAQIYAEKENLTDFLRLSAKWISVNQRENEIGSLINKFSELNANS